MKTTPLLKYLFYGIIIFTSCATCSVFAAKYSSENEEEPNVCHLEIMKRIDKGEDFSVQFNSLIKTFPDLDKDAGREFFLSQYLEAMAFYKQGYYNRDRNPAIKRN